MTAIVTEGWSDVATNVVLISNCCLKCNELMQNNSRDTVFRVCYAVFVTVFVFFIDFPKRVIKVVVG